MASHHHHHRQSGAMVLGSFWLPFAILTLLVCLVPRGARASIGDRSSTFLKCLDGCENATCKDARNLSAFNSARPWYHALLQWDCTSECQYQCMWHTVRAYEQNGHPIPQFYGKWPFVRVLGIQEPASAIFSLLNAASHLWAWHILRREVSGDSLRMRVWRVNVMLAVNAWFWSVAFHTRDTSFTEKMDYYCAFSLVLYMFLTFWMTNFEGYPWWMLASIPVPFLSFFLYHVYYLTWVRLDYQYNMQANVTVGVLNSLSWLAWCVKNRHRKYVWKCVIVILLVNSLLLLELWDFPPVWYVFDAHSLWHLGTVPVPFLWYSFVKDDILYLNKEETKIKSI